VDSITAGPDGNVWFADYANEQIGFITPAGVIREFPAPTPYNSLNDITRGADGALWFTRQDGVIGSITPAGTITTTTIATANSQPGGITLGPDGALWFTEMGADRIGRLAP
jgi:virginiamycin B lyase